MTLSRRTALKSAAVVTVAPSFVSSRASAALDLTAQENKLEVYRRIRGRNDGELALWWWNGYVWAKPNNDVAVHIMTVEGLTFQRLTLNAEGNLSEAQAGRGTFRDPDTNAPLESWTNPFNGVTAKPDHIRSLNRGVITPDGLERKHTERTLHFESEITAPMITGHQIFMRENFVTKNKGRAPGEVSTRSSLTTYTATASDIADDNADFRPATFNYQSLGGFRPWMEMDNSTGMLSWQTVGQKLERGSADAPASIKKWVDTNYPGFLDDPEI
jgi:hypothetical protein